MTITVDVLDRSDLTTSVASYPKSGQRKWRDAYNDPGSFSFVVQNDDTNHDQLAIGRVMQFSLNGTARWQGVIERIEKQTVAPGEEADEQTTVSGRGIAALCETAVVYPDGELARLPFSDHRFFNFASPAFDDSAWSGSVELTTRFLNFFGVLAPVIPRDWPVNPDTPIGNPVHMWSRDFDFSGGQHNMPVGTCYFRSTFTLSGTDNRQCRAFIAVDDNFELWIDGVLIDSYASSGIEGWFNTHSHDLLVSPGTHLVAIKATNIERPGNASNYASVLFDMWTMFDGSDQLDTQLLQSGAGWKCVDYPTVPPGFTPIAVLDALVAEAQARGALTDLSLVDEGAGLWDVAEVSFQIGDDLLSVLAHLSETLIDWRMAATGFVLHVYPSGLRSTMTAVAVEPGANVTKLTHTVQK